MIETKDVAVNEAPVKSLLDQSFQVSHAEHRNGALPADPGEVLRLRLEVCKGVTQEPTRQYPIQFSPEGDHSERLAHARPDELFGVRVQDDVVEWLRVAIEYRCHDAVAGCGDAVAEDCIYLVAGIVSRRTKGR